MRALLYFLGAVFLSQIAVWMDVAPILRAAWAFGAVCGGFSAALIALGSRDHPS